MPDVVHGAEMGTWARWHRRLIDALPALVGRGVDPGDLAFEVRSDRTTARVEAHLVARRALTLTLPDDSRLALPAGETIRTIVAAPSDHKRVAATLRGCSLDLHAWHEDASGRAAVAIATPSSVV